MLQFIRERLAALVARLRGQPPPASHVLVREAVDDIEAAVTPEDRARAQDAARRAIRAMTEPDQRG